jgi:hypothetical protein
MLKEKVGKRMTICFNGNNFFAVLHSRVAAGAREGGEGDNPLRLTRHLMMDSVGNMFFSVQEIPLVVEFLDLQACSARVICPRVWDLGGMVDDEDQLMCDIDDICESFLIGERGGRISARICHQTESVSVATTAIFAEENVDGTEKVLVKTILALACAVRKIREAMCDGDVKFSTYSSSSAFPPHPLRAHHHHRFD